MTTNTAAAAQTAELVRCLGTLGAGAGSATALARAAAVAVIAATGALDAAIYQWEEPLPDASGRKPRLVLLGTARRMGVAADAARRRRMRFEARAALGSRAALPAESDGLGPWRCVAQALALRDGAAAIAACCAEQDAPRLRATLAGAAGALALVVRLARAEDQLARTQGVLAQTRTIVTHSTDAILTVDSGYRIVAANPAVAEVLDREGAPVLGALCRDALACQDERGRQLCDTPECPLTQAFATPATAPYRDLLWRTGAGTRRAVSASFAGVPYDEGWRAVVIARDSTPVKAANRMRSNFISMVSHELRTPLNSLNGFLEIVLEGQAGPLRPRQEEFLNYARTSTHALMRLVEDIVFISRADTGQFTVRREATDVAELVAPVLRAHQLEAASAGLELRAELPANLPRLCVDESRIQQVLHNLVMNAIKFTPAPGRVTIGATHEPKALRLAVRDTGPGVAPEDQVRIFERFYQSESSTRGNATGYGLGLAIAKLIVEQHGGRIWVESPPGGGATFAFTAPLVEHGVPCPPDEG
jgi:two-component system phosphate regulon sensor histidine kinase PhoR